MPYIQKSHRMKLDKVLQSFEDSIKNDDISYGDFNYLISSMINIQLKYYNTNYQTINGLIGVLECAKLELYRRIATPYEEKKILENGDVYE